MLEAVTAETASALSAFCEKDNFGVRVFSSYLDAPSDASHILLTQREKEEIQAAFSLIGAQAVVCGKGNIPEILSALKFFGCQGIFSSLEFAELSLLPISESGLVLRYSGKNKKISLPFSNQEKMEFLTAENLREALPLLREILPKLNEDPFGKAYVELSHRLRHGRCRGVLLRRKETFLSFAMTSAETETSAVIGPVYTLPRFRNRGYAGFLTRNLSEILKNEKKTCFLCCEPSLLSFYEKIGWEKHGEWAILCI